MEKRATHDILTKVFKVANLDTFSFKIDRHLIFFTGYHARQDQAQVSEAQVLKDRQTQHDSTMLLQKARKQLVGGGFISFYLYLYLGKWSLFDLRIFFNWVETQLNHLS